MVGTTCQRARSQAMSILCHQSKVGRPPQTLPCSERMLARILLWPNAFLCHTTGFAEFETNRSWATIDIMDRTPPMTGLPGKVRQWWQGRRRCCTIGQLWQVSRLFSDRKIVQRNQGSSRKLPLDSNTLALESYRKTFWIQCSNNDRIRTSRVK